MIDAVLLVTALLGAPPPRAVHVGPGGTLTIVPALGVAGSMRPGLRPRSDALSERMGQLTVPELRAFQALARARGRSLLVTGSLSETNIGLYNRTHAPHRLPSWRRRSPVPSLVRAPGGVPTDVDLWAGSDLAPEERDALAGFFARAHGVRPEIDDAGYSLVKYPTPRSFAPPLRRRQDADDDGGGLIFYPDGRIARLRATWQRAPFRRLPREPRWLAPRKRTGGPPWAPREERFASE